MNKCKEDLMAMRQDVENENEAVFYDFGHQAVVLVRVNRSPLRDATAIANGLLMESGAKRSQRDLNIMPNIQKSRANGSCRNKYR